MRYENELSMYLDVIFAKETSSQFTLGKSRLMPQQLERHSPTSAKAVLWDVMGEESGKENDSAGKEERNWERGN